MEASSDGGRGGWEERRKKGIDSLKEKSREGELLEAGMGGVGGASRAIYTHLIPSSFSPTTPPLPSCSAYQPHSLSTCERGVAI